MWIKSILIITISIIVLFGLVSLYGKYQWQSSTDKLRAKLTDGRQTINLKTYDSKEFEGLPDPVQRYFQAVLKDGQPIVAAVNLTQQGLFNMSEAKAKWSPFTATQFVTTQQPGFDWDARIQMAPGVSAFVHDAYALGAGSLHVSLLGLFNVADVRDTPAAAQGELLRFFAEMPWYPTALLPSQGVRWEAIDDTSARATMTDGATTVSLVFRFNAEGTILLQRGYANETMRAEARRDKLTTMPWSGRFWNYSTRDGMLIPLQGEVGWEYPDGIRLYYKGKVTEINYEFAT
jgi:hypothetical protein